MKIIGILLLILGLIGMVLSGTMFGDIGVAGMIGALTALLSGIGFCVVSKRLKGGKPS